MTNVCATRRGVLGAALTMDKERCKAALRDAGVAATVRTMPGLNHLFQPAARGTIDEYAVIDVTVDPAVLALVGDWILAQPPRPPASR